MKVQWPKSRFVTVACKKCKHKQTIFNKASTVVKCLKCGDILAKPAGGKVKIYGRLLKELG